MKSWIIMRSNNDMPYIAETLAMVVKQNVSYELIVFDNDSTDGTRQEVEKYTDRVINVPAGTYVPGKVLNRAVNMTEGEYIVFLNSDCTPQHNQWLENLLKGFTSDKIAAVFGRQVPRPDCQTMHAKDTEETYGDGGRQKYWKHCFSMASSAIRRSVWEEMQFNENIQYSEDIEWTWQARKRGYEIKYVPDSVAVHSHNYNIKQFYRRHYGEGRAEAVFFDWSGWEAAWFRYSLMSYSHQVLNDWKYSLKNKTFSLAWQSPFFRFSQMLGRRAGFLVGLKEKEAKKR